MKLGFFRFLIIICLLVVASAHETGAQGYASGSARMESAARAADSVTLSMGGSVLKLWGLQPVFGMSAPFNLRARTALDNAIGRSNAVCEVKSRMADTVYAQCANRDDKDLGLLMLQQGYATVDRAQVFGTPFEEPYVQAEMQAQSMDAGVWGEETGKSAGGGEAGTAFVSFGFALFLCLIAVFAVLSVIIMRGFQRVIDAQNRNVDMISHERRLRDQERRVVAVMLDSELKANKAKIEAYRVVYEEMLRSLRDPDKTPRYKKAGDVIQRQPALARSVFDRNADKIDILGDRLSSELIHFYARIKSRPEYITIEPNAPLDEVIEILEKNLRLADRLRQLAEKLLAAFANSGISSENYDDEANF